MSWQSVQCLWWNGFSKKQNEQQIILINIKQQQSITKLQVFAFGFQRAKHIRVAQFGEWFSVSIWMCVVFLF